MLLRRLLEGGADINFSVPKFGRPLLVLVDNASVQDDVVGLFYAELFARPDLDLLARSKRTGRSFAETVIRFGRYRKDGDLEGRVRAYLAAAGHDVEAVLTATEA